MTNGEYSVVGKYCNRHTNVDIRHNICGTILSITPINFYHGTRCKRCFDYNRRKKPDFFLNKVKNMYGNEYKPLTPYVKSKDKLTMLHTVCGNTWEVTPDNFLRRHSKCPYCNKNAKRTQSEFKNYLKNILGTTYQLESKYINARTPVKIRHLICNKVWNPTPDSLTHGTKCPYCRESRGEQLVAKILDELSINYLQQYKFKDCVYKQKLPFDFYIPSMRIAIEYDGIQHYKPTLFGGYNKSNEANKTFKNGKIRDSIKTKYCYENKINLLRIPYTLNKTEVTSVITNTILQQGSKAEQPDNRLKI